MGTSPSDLFELRAAASARGFEWLESQNWYEGRLEGEFVVAQTDTAPITDPTRGPCSCATDTHGPGG